MSDDVKVVSDSENAYSESDIFPDYFEPESGSEQESNSRSLYLATLKLNKVRPEQKGVYKCGPSNTRSASVELHITDGKPYLFSAICQTCVRTLTRCPKQALDKAETQYGKVLNFQTYICQ